MLKKIDKTYLMTMLILLILIVVSYINFVHSKNNIIQLIQNESGNTLNATISQLKDHFLENKKDLTILAEIIKKEEKYNNGLSLKDIINEVYQKSAYYELGILDAEGNYVYNSIGSNNKVGKNINEYYSGALKNVVNLSYSTQKTKFSDIFSIDESNLGIATIVPIISENKVTGAVIAVCKTSMIGNTIIYRNFINTENTVFGIDKAGIRVFSLYNDLIGKNVYDSNVFPITDLARSNYEKMTRGVKFMGEHDGVYLEHNKYYDIEKKYIVSRPVYIDEEFKFSLAVTNPGDNAEFLDNFIFKELGLFIAFVIVIVFLYYRILKSYYEKKQLQKSLKKTEESEKLKTEFFCNMSHELRTPLTIILNGLHFILKKHEKDIEKDLELKKMVLKIRQNALRLLKLVNNLLEISRIDAGMISREPENRDIIKIVEDIAMSVVFYAQQKGIDLIFDTELEEKIIAMDEEGIERVIMNLLSNSIKFTPSGGKILVNIYEDKEYLNVSVKDTGIGIPDDKRQFIFERFTQINDSELIRMAEGTGIGLAIVKSIVESHNGKIEVYSNEGQGTEFIIRLPNRVIENKEVAVTKKLDQEILNSINIEFSDIH